MGSCPFATGVWLAFWFAHRLTEVWPQLVTLTFLGAFGIWMGRHANPGR